MIEKTENKGLYYQRVQQSSEFLNKWNGKEKIPEIAIVLGSGLSNAIPNFTHMRSINFVEIPGFKKTNVPGHTGELRIGKVFATAHHTKQKERTIAFLHGRNHAYEGNDPGEVVHNIRTLIHWGVKGIILTNAAGCLNTSWHLGKMMLISDHINLTGLSSIAGKYGEDFGPRFVDMTFCYTHSWQSHFKDTAAQMDEELYSGVYCGVLGPQYETPAEIRMMQNLGGHVVGMSTVLEAIAARQMGAKIAGISCLTNYGAGLHNQFLTHEEVVAMGKKFSSNIASLILNTVVDLET